MHTKNNPLALVVDGPSLTHIFADTEQTQMLMELVGIGCAAQHLCHYSLEGGEGGV